MVAVPAVDPGSTQKTKSISSSAAGLAFNTSQTADEDPLMMANCAAGSPSSVLVAGAGAKAPVSLAISRATTPFETAGTPFVKVTACVLTYTVDPAGILSI